MLYAMKGNRQYKITEDEKQKFIDRNYKIAKLENNELVFEEIETEGSKEIAKLEADYEKLKIEYNKLLEKLEEYKKLMKMNLKRQRKLKERANSSLF